MLLLLSILNLLFQLMVINLSSCFFTSICQHVCTGSGLKPNFHGSTLEKLSLVWCNIVLSDSCKGPQQIRPGWLSPISLVLCMILPSVRLFAGNPIKALLHIMEFSFRLTHPASVVYMQERHLSLLLPRQLRPSSAGLRDTVEHSFLAPVNPLGGCRSPAGLGEYLSIPHGYLKYTTTFWIILETFKGVNHLNL